MYSYADRIRAVALYIKLGLRVRATIRQLGYPTKNALKGWYQHYLKHQDLPASQAPRAPKYSLQQRQVAIAHYLAHDRCIRSEEHTSELQSQSNLVCRLLLEKKNIE